MLLNVLKHAFADLLDLEHSDHSQLRFAARKSMVSFYAYDLGRSHCEYIYIYIHDREWIKSFYKDTRIITYLYKIPNYNRFIQNTEL
jgi:hypothetical protein